MVGAFACIAIYFVSFYIGILNSIVSVSVYLGFVYCLLLSVVAFLLSLKLFSPRNTFKIPLRFGALLVSVLLIGFSIYAFFFSAGDAAPLIPWFYNN